MPGRGHGARAGPGRRAVLAAGVSLFGTYAVFVLLGYLKDVDADRVTHYNTIAVRFGARAAIIASAAFVAPGLAASVWPVEPWLTPLWAILWAVGVVVLIVAHVLAWNSKSDGDAWPGIQASVHGFVALHLGEAALVEPKWTATAWLLFAASIAAMLRRPVRRHVRPVTTPSHRVPVRRALVLLNPNARRGQGRDRYRVVQPGIDELFETRVAETEPAGNDGAVRAALDDGIRTFIAAGGDGTVNALIDALVRLRGTVALDDLTLGAVGLGSSNDAHKPIEREIRGIPCGSTCSAHCHATSASPGGRAANGRFSSAPRLGSRRRRSTLQP